MIIVRRAIDIDVSRFLTKLARKQVDWNDGVRWDLGVPPLLFRYHALSERTKKRRDVLRSTDCNSQSRGIIGQQGVQVVSQMHLTKI